MGQWYFILGSRVIKFLWTEVKINSSSAPPQKLSILMPAQRWLSKGQPSLLSFLAPSSQVFQLLQRQRAGAALNCLSLLPISRLPFRNKGSCLRNEVWISNLGGWLEMWVKVAFISRRLGPTMPSITLWWRNTYWAELIMDEGATDDRVRWEVCIMY